MPLLIRNIPLGLDEPEDVLPARAARRLKIPTDAIRLHAVVRRAIDARAGRVQLICNLEVALRSRRDEDRVVRRLHRTDVGVIKPMQPVRCEIGSEPMPGRPVIVGFGPAGIFAALHLAEHGYRPVVLERGRPVRQRHADVLKRFWRERDFDPESNLLFGEGGAGCYSDGKLKTRINDPRVAWVLQCLYVHGADPDILTDSRPHVGSDRLPSICRRIRERIERLGGEVRFESKLDGVEVDDGIVSRLRLAGGQSIAVRAANGSAGGGAPVILGIGHSARDTFGMLVGAGIQLAVKPFQVGVRIEHPQERIDQWMYRSSAGHPRLGAASYQVVAKGAAGPMGDVFSFCMCPGGQVVPSNESAGRVVVNGASRSRRNAPTGNSALVITVGPDEVGDDPLGALAFLDELEQRAFHLAGEDYHAPVQRAADFVAGRASDGDPTVSYPLGGRWCDLAALLPSYLTRALAKSLELLDTRMQGFAGRDALLLAPETRASCPVRILRDSQTRASISASNLFPVGEGAGYAGGIMSSAVDGLRTAEAIMARYAPLT